MKRNILVLTDDASSVVQYYRMAGPLLDMPEQFNVTFCKPSECTWRHFTGIDVVGVCRPDSQLYLRVLKMARYYGCEIWVDHDDWLLGVRVDNPAFMHYQKEETQHYIKECLQIANIVTFSTQELCNLFGEGNGGQYAIGGHLVKNSYRNTKISRIATEAA